jgi:nucleotide-binding universal stress UspA family protein
VTFKKILLALEQGRGGGPSLFEQALDLAAKESSELMLLHCIAEGTMAEFEERIGVVAGLEQSQSLGELDHLRQRELEHVRGWLDSLCAGARERGIRASSVVEIGHAGPAIVKTAEHWGADLIVLGRTRHSTLRDCLAGGVSVYVSHHAHCSVLSVCGEASEARQGQSPVPREARAPSRDGKT